MPEVNASRDRETREPMLAVRGLRVAYGGINAVKGIDFTVNAGEMVTLIGANGAGKTTTLKALTGLVRPAAGRVQYNGDDVTAMPSHRLVALGIALMAVFGILAWSILDNAAHLGGLLTGATAGLWLFREDDGSLPLPEAPLRSGFGWIGVGAFLALFAFTAWKLVEPG